MCISDELIQIGREQLRNEQRFIHFPLCIFILSLGASFNTNSNKKSKNPTLQNTCAVIWIKIDSAKKFAITSTTFCTESDFKSEYLIRMCSVETNLVTSLEFQPVLSATMLFHFGRTRNGYVAILFTLLTSTAERTATSGYMVVPERFGQIEEPDSTNEERAEKKLTFVPSSEFNRCNMETHVNMKLIHH